MHKFLIYFRKIILIGYCYDSGIKNSSVDKTPSLSFFKETSNVHQNKFKSNKNDNKSRSPITSESNGNMISLYLFTSGIKI